MNRLAKTGLALLCASAACNDSDPRGWLVDRTRVLAARVEALADSGRASLAPDEKARVRWLIASPDGAIAPTLAWAFAACVAPEGTDGVLRCDGTPLTTGSGAGDSAEPLDMPFDVPPLAATGDATELLFLSAFCAEGPVTLDAHAFTATCGDATPALLASVDIRLAAAGANRNPEIAGDAIQLDGAVLPEAAARSPGAACEGAPDAPSIAAGSADHTFAYRFRGDEREATPNEGDPFETLVLSHVVTAGKLDRQYSYLDPTTATPTQVSVTWTPPSTDAVGTFGLVVALHFVVRDGRGGAAFTRRTVCVRRP